MRPPPGDAATRPERGDPRYLPLLPTSGPGLPLQGAIRVHSDSISGRRRMRRRFGRIAARKDLVLGTLPIHFALTTYVAGEALSGPPWRSRADAP